MEPKIFTLPFIKKEQVSFDAWAFYFDRKNVNFNFLPGHYIRMTLPHAITDKRGNSRLFSICSSPLEKEYIMITTRIIESSFKKALLKLAPGKDVQFFGPMGNFVLRDEEKTSRIFLAGGIGITPFASMIRYAVLKNSDINITLFVSFSSINDMIFYNELTEITKLNPYIKVIYTITQEDSSNWAGEKGRISPDLIKKYIPDIQAPMYFIAGPQAMVTDMITLIKGMGVTEEKIKKETFVGY